MLLQGPQIFALLGQQPLEKEALLLVSLGLQLMLVVFDVLVDGPVSIVLLLLDATKDTLGAAIIT